MELRWIILLLGMKQGIDNRNQYQGDQRRSGQPTDNRPCQRGLGVGSFTDAQRQGQQAQDGGQGRHQNRPQPAAAGFGHGIAGAHPVLNQAAGLVHQQDRVVDHDSPQHNTADVGLHIQRRFGEKQGQQHPDRRQRNGKHDNQRIAQGFKRYNNL